MNPTQVVLHVPLCSEIFAAYLTMANNVNGDNHAHSTNPGATITTDIKPAPTGDNTGHFNHSNPITTAKFRCQPKNRNQQQTFTVKITPKQQHHDEATHQATQPKREEDRENVRITGDIFSLFNQNPTPTDKTGKQTATPKSSMKKDDQYVYKLCSKYIHRSRITL